MAEQDRFDQSKVQQCKCVGSLSCGAVWTHGLGSHMIQVQISRIVRGQLERASHLAAKSHMRNHDSARPGL